MCRRPRIGRGLASLILAASISASWADEVQPSFTTRALRALNESTPVGLLPREARQPGWKGWFADLWEGSKRNFKGGDAGLLLPLFTFHPAYKYPNRDDNNNFPYGVGYARTLVDGKDNERMVYALAFSDSHYDFQPVLGWAWLARWPLFGSVKGGLGYTAFLTARADANYLPFPAFLPLASIGTDRVTFYGSWIPTTEVLFFFARVTLPQNDSSPPVERGDRPAGPFGAGFARDGSPRTNLLYAGGGWVNTDASGIDSVAAGNSWAPVGGFRHFFTDRLAVDVAASRSSHSLDLNDTRLGTFDLLPVTITAQYHVPTYRGLRMYAGAGIAYSRITGQDMPGFSLSRDSFSPVLQAGANFRLTDAMVLTGGLTVNFPRHQLYRDGELQGTVKLAPATFGLAVGYAF
ncbi:MAG: outer membrane beta-barrel protein [Burkholderiales bacterium]|nr:outer membrane beta-barrel protein [Burkholderiales bacterium]